MDQKPIAAAHSVLISEKTCNKKTIPRVYRAERKLRQ